MPRILVACEFSGIVREAFSRKGWDAWSCDFLPTEIPGNHYQGDVRDILSDPSWDLLVAHPPCTHLAVSGALHFEKKRRSGEQSEAIRFFYLFLNAPVKRICVENTVSIISSIFRPPNQIVHPYLFGDEFSKQTHLWLKNLPKLKPTNIVSKGEFKITKRGKKMAVWMYKDLDGMNDLDRKKIRSKTFSGIAAAMAEQWSGLKDNPTTMKGFFTKRTFY